MSEWMPIETAPKDGNPILAYYINGGAYATYRVLATDTGEWWNWGSAGEYVETPTHWMPLPLPPTMRGRKQ